MKSLSIKAAIVVGLGLVLAFQLAANALTCKVNKKLVVSDTGIESCVNPNDLEN